jgi:hypothetical protein
LPAAGWSEVGEWLDRGGRLDARYQAARWALETLQAQLGDDWLERAARASDGGFPLNLDLLGAHTHALAEALEWALRLEMCRLWDGSADFMRDLIQNPTPGRIRHSQSQLLQASLAARLGWPVVLEPEKMPGAPADLEIATPSGPMVVEIRVLTPRRFGEDQRAVAEGASNWLFDLHIKHGIWIGGRLGRDPDEEERLEIEDFVKREAPNAKAGARPRYTSADISLALTPPGTTAPAVTGPPVREDLFTRMVRTLAAKVERMETLSAGWLHATVMTGLWAFTPWGGGRLADKAPTMSAALSEALGGRVPQGLILTLAASLAPDDFKVETAESPAGVSFRTGVSPLRARESLVLPFTPEGAAQAARWLEVARSEEGWLPWALSQKGLPSLDEMLRLNTA